MDLKFNRCFVTRESRDEMDAESAMWVVLKT